MHRAKKSGVIFGLATILSATWGAEPVRADAIEDWLSGDYATGDWGGVRTQLEEAGITPEAAYTTDMMAVGNGNAGSGDGWDYAGRIDFGINFDFEKLAGIPGFSLYTSGAWSSGHNLSDRQVGNMFAVQQIYTGREVRLSEMYLQQQLLEDRLSFKVGRLTTENDFISSDIYANYVNGGINGTPSNVPGGNFGFTTAPFAQWGVVAAREPGPRLRLAAGVYNANEHSVDDTRNGVDFDLDPGDGVLAIGEIGYSWNQPAEEEAAETTTAAAEAHQPAEDEPASGGYSGLATLPGMIKVGGLYESGDREDIKDGGNKNGNPGLYVSLQQMVYEEPDGKGQGLTPWMVVTYLPRQSINENPVFFGGGLVYKGLIPTRDDDNTALGFFYGNLSKDLQPGGSEKVFEMAYTVQVTPWFYVRPDIQLVFDPAGVSSADTAIVGGGEIGIVF